MIDNYMTLSILSLVPVCLAFYISYRKRQRRKTMLRHLWFIFWLGIWRVVTDDNNLKDKSSIEESPDSSDSNQSISRAIKELATEMGRGVDSLTSLSSQFKKEKEKLIKQSRIDEYLLPLLTIIPVIFTILATSYWNIHSEKINRNYRAAESLQQVIQNNKNLASKVNLSMADIRDYRRNLHKFCSGGKYTGNKNEYLAQRDKFGFNLQKYHYDIRRDFNVDIYNQIIGFQKAMDESVDRFCSEQATTDEELKLMQRQINNSIDKELSQKRNIVMKLKDIEKVKPQ